MKIRSILALILVAGLLWACETTDPLIRDAQISAQLMDYESALEYSEQALEADSSNALAHYYRGYALGGIAQETEPPSDRRPVYEEMRDAMESARSFGEVMESRPGELDEIDDYIVSLWAYEHNAGAQIMTDDSTRQATENPDQTAVDHFENAITIEPDSSISYVVLSSINYQMGNVDEAISMYETAISKMDEPLADDYEFLISLYFMDGSYEEARNLAMEAVEAYPDEPLFAQFLADTYLETGESEKATELLRELIAGDPDNPQFYFALGTQLYRMAQDHLDEASGAYERAYQMEEQAGQLSSSEQEEVRQEAERIRTEGEAAEEEGNRLADMAVEEMQNVIELTPNDDSAYNILGIIYQNRAAAQFDKRNNTLDNELSMQYDQNARDYLQESMQYYERAAELNPDEPEYWQSLFQIYTTLGMDEEAEEAMEKANF